MKSIIEISNDIKENFKDRSGYDIADNTVIDNFVLASSDAVHDALIEIENNKNPHLYTNLKESELDELGLLLNIPRREDEDDETYHYRMLNWRSHYETGNYTAIVDSILNLKYSANANYVPFTFGSGTGSVYIIPKEYDDETISKAIDEAKSRMENVVSPDSYVEYIIVKPISVKLIINLLTYPNSDINNIKNMIEIKLKEHINSIKPGDTLSTIDLQRIGIMQENIKYFSITNMYINNELFNDFEIVQHTKNKFILDDIEWMVIKEGEINA